MTLIEQIDAANLLVSNIYNTIETKGVQPIMDASKNTSFLSDTISKIYVNVPTVIQLTDQIAIDKSINTYTKVASGNTCYNPVSVNFAVQAKSAECINIDITNNISYSTTNYLTDNACIELKTDYYKQLETDGDTNVLKLNAYTVPIGFYDVNGEANILADDKADDNYRIYNFACILTNLANDITDSLLSQGVLSYNFVDINFDETGAVANTSYGAEHGADYVRLFTNAGISIHDASIAENIGVALANCRLENKAETIADHFANINFANISKARIYYNLHLLIPGYCHTGDIFVTTLQKGATLKNIRIQSVFANIPAFTDRIDDIVQETSSRMSVAFNCINE